MTSKQTKNTQKSFSQQTRFFMVMCVVGVIAIGFFFFQALGDSWIGLTLRTNDMLNQGLLAQWTFDAGTFSGGTISDVSGNGKNLSYAGGSSCSAGSTQTLTFVQAGTSTFVVPAGVTSVTVKAWGGGGGGGSASIAGDVGPRGGGGGFAQGTFAVTPGDTLSVLTGGGGQGGFNGGNGGGGGGGGGYSGVHKNYTYYLIAGGGGGGGGTSNVGEIGGYGGAGGGLTGSNGTRGLDGACNGSNAGVGDNGDGGTQSAGGAGGSGCNTYNDGTAGSSLQGGNGGDGVSVGGTEPAGGAQGGGNGGVIQKGGGGGGGGYFGGGGGEAASSTDAASEGAGGGGGGSSYLSPSGTATSTTGGSGPTPANTGDSSYIGNAGLGGATSTIGSVGGNGNDGLIVLTYTQTSACDSPTDSPAVFTTLGTTTWSVPLGVTSVTIKVWGAGGGSGSSGSSGTQNGGQGGGGGFAQGTFAVTPGDTLSVLVGGGGGGGLKGSPFAGGGGAGGGGGFSAVHKNYTYYLIAGGGGGGGASGDGTGEHGGVGGPGGGTTGISGMMGLDDPICNNGTPDPGNPGAGGTQSSGGAGGGGCSSGTDGTAGSAFQAGIGGGPNGVAGKDGGVGGVLGGGNGGFGNTGGGGGGGGYFGGGGGERGVQEGAGGGGGGSSYLSPSGTVTSTTAGNGTAAGNNGDSNYGGSAGLGAATTTSGGVDGSAGNGGRVVISYTGGSGAGLTQAQGAIGQSMYFNGAIDAASTTSAINGVQTIAFWANPTTTTQSILALGPSGKNVTLVGGVVTTGLVSPTIYVDGAVTTTFPADKQWHHVVVTTGTAVNATAFALGVASSTYYGGSLDDVRLYSRVLSVDEVTRLYGLGATTRVGVTLSSNPAQQDGLITWWTFDGKDIDLSKNTGEVRDRSPTGLNGDWKNHASTTVPGAIGQGINFDGLDGATAGDVVTAADHAVFDTLSAVTVAAWVKPNALGQANIVIKQHGTSPFMSMQLWMTSGNIVKFDVENTSLTLGSISSNMTLSTGNWYHVVGTWTAGQSPKIYINGVDVSTGASGAPTGTLLNSNGNLSVGGDGVNDNINATLDDVRIYSRALSPTEITRLYQMGGTARIGTTIQKNTGQQSGGLIGWWTMDGPDINLTLPTAEVRDRSGQGVHGDWKNHATTTAPGAVGQAISFDGVDDFIDLGSNYAFQPNTPFSVTTWVYTTESTLTKGIISRRSAAGAGWDVSISTSRQINLAIGDSGSTKYFISTTGIAAIPLGKWTHVAATYDGTDANGMHIYINGVEKAATIGDNDSGGSITYTNTAQIGATLGGNYMTGRIDNLRLYNRVLSPAEVNRLYKVGE